MGRQSTRSTSFLQSFLNWFSSLLGLNQPVEHPGGTGSIAPVHKRVSLIILDPILESEGGRRMTEVMRWNNPDQMAARLVEDMQLASHGYARYEIVEREVRDDFPPLEDGFCYTSEEFMRCWRARQGFHQPAWVDYHHLLQRHNIIEKINHDQIDEVWTVGFPYAGFYESRMAGPGAFWCNAPPLPNTDSARRRFVVMAFNFERGQGEMLESMGHRAESIMDHVYKRAPEPYNLWKLFTRHEKTHPGQAQVGTVHFAPNSQADYDWGNPAKVSCRSRCWENFPDLSGEPELADAQAWGGGDMRAHHLWWFRLMPHVEGKTQGISNNWWEYIIDPNLA